MTRKIIFVFLLVSIFLVSTISRDVKYRGSLVESYACVVLNTVVWSYVNDGERGIKIILDFMTSVADENLRGFTPKMYVYDITLSSARRSPTLPPILVHRCE